MRIFEYQTVVARLLSKRDDGISDDEEGRIAEMLDCIWRRMSLDEQLTVDDWVRKVVGT